MCAHSRSNYFIIERISRVIILPPIYYLNIKKKPILNSFRLNPISAKTFQNSAVFSLGVIIVFDTFDRILHQLVPTPCKKYL